MQFYIINKDPELNAKLLPDYSLKNVNVREGWQMLSDIGHARGITWQGQNAEYNRYHPNTWRHWKTKVAFMKFCNHYHGCLIEYKHRFKKTTVFHDYFDRNENTIFSIFRLIEDYTEEQATIKYLLDRKSKHLTQEEIIRLQESI